MQSASLWKPIVAGVIGFLGGLFILGGGLGGLFTGAFVAWLVRQSTNGRLSLTEPVTILIVVFTFAAIPGLILGLVFGNTFLAPPPYPQSIFEGMSAPTRLVVDFYGSAVVNIGARPYLFGGLFVGVLSGFWTFLDQRTRMLPILALAAFYAILSGTLLGVVGELEALAYRGPDLWTYYGLAVELLGPLRGTALYVLTAGVLGFALGFFVGAHVRQNKMQDLGG